MALKTWDEIGNLGLTAAQKNVAAAFEVIGATAETGSPPPDISGVTAENAKKIRNFVRDLNRIQLADRGARYVLQRLRDDTGKAAVDAVPNGTL